jgi:hypothetical protein
MKHKTFTLLLILGLILVLGGLLSSQPKVAGAQEPDSRRSIGIQQTPLDTIFTYQGRLFDTNGPVDGNFDFEFKLFNDPDNGNQVGSTVTEEGVIVTEGIFTVKLDFDSDIFVGDARWLEVGVRPGNSTDGFTTLAPRQELTPVPYALALPGLRTQPHSTSPNVIGGYSGNTVTDGAWGATISGGGRPEQFGEGPNIVTDRYGTIGGGLDNHAGNQTGTIWDASHATVGGGSGNTASGICSTVGGGSSNDASGEAAMVPGGFQNEAVGDFSYAAGFCAKAEYAGSFVWADSSSCFPKFASTVPNQFLVRATGGVFFDTGDSALNANGDLSVAGNATVNGNLNVGTLNGAAPSALQVPSGAVMFFNLTACPSGWSPLSGAQGRYLVGLPSGGTLGGTVGTALTNLENRPVGRHTHSITDPGHSHTLDLRDSVLGEGYVGNSGSGQDVSDTTTAVSTSNITINAAGGVDGTNAPYLQLLVCQKD